MSITKVGHHLPRGAVTGRVEQYDEAGLEGGYVVIDDAVTIHVRTCEQARCIAELFQSLAQRLMYAEADPDVIACVRAGLSYPPLVTNPSPEAAAFIAAARAEHPWRIGDRVRLVADYDGLGVTIGAEGTIRNVYDGVGTQNGTGYSYDVDVEGMDYPPYMYGSELVRLDSPEPVYRMGESEPARVLAEPLTSAEAELLAAVDVHGEYGVGSILRVTESGRVGTVESVTDARGEAAYRLSFGCGSRHEWYAHHEVAPEMITEETH